MIIMDCSLVRDGRCQTSSFRNATAGLTSNTSSARGSSRLRIASQSRNPTVVESDRLAGRTTPAVAGARGFANLRVASRLLKLKA